MSDENLTLELQKIGLDDRAAKVYLAALELGPSPVQKIAQRADVPRATTYLVLDDLKAKGLISTYNQGKKTFFIANSPQNLQQLMDSRVDEVKAQRDSMSDIIPKLMERGQFEQQDKPTVKYYEGADGLKSYVRDMLRTPGEEVVNIFSHDAIENMFTKAGITWDNISERRRRTKTRRRAIYTWKDRAPEPDAHNKEFTQYVPFEELPVAADIAVKGNKVGLIPYAEPTRCVIIEDAAVAAMLKLMFDKLWQQYKINPKTIDKTR